MDIVERLKKMVGRGDYYDDEYRAAINEIERLRGELKFTDEVRQSALQSLLSAENEIERLRKRVEFLENEMTRTVGALELWVRIGKQALKEKE
jgi:polyhydroxyalkanoate synthesis regulator phasin